MSTIHKSSEGKLIAFMKGAPEVVLSLCTHIFLNGRTRELSERGRKAIIKTNENMASKALRVLGFAFKELTDVKMEDFKVALDERVEDNFVFVGLIGMIDPPREEAIEANKKCEKAGIKTVMITGDHKLTAVAVAKEIGIMKEESSVLTGAELENISEEEFEKIVEDIGVYARVSPGHKLRIVNTLKKKGHIVAMTGDGVNDAPALKLADIGVAMGITGTDVTKEASDMVLIDDNFATIVNAVEGGRTIYDNIRKFSFFLLRSNFDELFVIGTFALLGLELPLTAGMILWINLMTDGPPAIALSQDPPSEDVMERSPRRQEESLLYGRFASILATLVTQFIGTGVLFYVAYYMWHMPLENARTLAFMQATLQELVVLWNCRSETKNAFRVGFTNNKYLLLAVIFSAVITIAVPYTRLFGTIPLTVYNWMLVIPISLTGFLILPEVLYNKKILKWR
jgi:Ca2+-transporting ATPase